MEYVFVVGWFDMFGVYWDVMVYGFLFVILCFGIFSMVIVLMLMM